MIITNIFSFLLPALLFTISTIVSFNNKRVDSTVKVALMFITTAHWLALFNHSTLNSSIIFILQLLIVITNLSNPKASKNLLVYFLFSLFLIYFNLFYA